MLPDILKGFMEFSELPHTYSRWSQYWGADFLGGWLRVQHGPIRRDCNNRVDPMVAFSSDFTESLMIDKLHLLQKRDDGGGYDWICSWDDVEGMESALRGYINFLKYEMDKGE
jgi:hypothetical protein